uniref:Uncharacterized protein n=1 Tax=Magnetococcus massalia (strain MO-1) TaxID=451514 RepID=A0A1S7LKN7_MAGMO|nr:Exported protein of unknown function [Candidatus Magnetococcus massalia]
MTNRLLYHTLLTPAALAVTLLILAPTTSYAKDVRWIPVKAGDGIPPGVQAAGYEDSTARVKNYICRGLYKGGLYIGYTNRGTAVCRIKGHDGEAFLKPLELLAADGDMRINNPRVHPQIPDGPVKSNERWRVVKPGRTPQGALIAGRQDNNKPLRICRVIHRNNAPAVGYVGPGMRTCHYNIWGGPSTSSTFEVLVGKTKSNTLESVIDPKHPDVVRLAKQSDNSRWRPGVLGSIHSDTVAMGHEQKETDVLAACRGFYDNALVVGYLRPGSKTCNLSYGKDEKFAYHYQTLASKTLWVKPVKQALPDKAIQGGYENDGRPLYICRAAVGKTLRIGNAPKNMQTCYTSMNGRIYRQKSFEILTAQALSANKQAAENQALFESMWKSKGFGSPLGHEKNWRDKISACRFKYKGHLIVGKRTKNSTGGCRAAFEGRRLIHRGRLSEDHSLLITKTFGKKLTWRKAEQGKVPKGAIKAGHDVSGNPTYICRGKVMLTRSGRKIKSVGLQIGHANKSMDYCHVEYGNAARKFLPFYVLSFK